MFKIFVSMKSLSCEELIAFINEELTIPNNPRVIKCFSKKHPDDFHKFIIIEDDITITQPWQGGPQNLYKGDYLHADINDIFGIESFIFERCFSPMASN